MADNSPEKLVFELIANVKNFGSQIKGALDNAQKLIQDFQKRAKNTLSNIGGSELGFGFTQFAELDKALRIAQKQFDELKLSTLGWKEAAKQAAVEGTNTKGLFESLADASARYGISLQQAAINAIASGQAQVNAIQSVLAANGKAVLQQGQISQAIAQLQTNLVAAGKAAITYGQNVQVATQQTQQLGQTAQKTSTAFGGIAKSITSLVGAFSIIGATQQAFDFLKQAADATIDYAQAQFTLAVNVRAASNATNGQSGTMEEWQTRIQALRKELRIFSETDITKAINQTTVLTRVLGLNADQQEQVIRIGAALAQMTGVELSQGVDDVTKALGGSSVVLDKYGLFLRDADKGASAFELGFTEKIEKGTNSLNSQQLAMATLATILKQVNPLMEELTGYQETLPGQIKEVDAAVTDANKRLGESFDTIVLGMKQAYLDFVTYLSQILDNPVLNKVKEMVDTAIMTRQGQIGAGGGRTIEPSAVPGVSKGIGANFLGGSPILQDATTGIRFYSRDQLAGDKANVDAYFDLVQSEIAKVSAAIRSGDNSLTREEGDSKPIPFDYYNSPSAGYGASGGQPGVMDEEFIKAQEKLGSELVDNFNDMTKAQRDAALNRNAELNDANEDFLQDLEDINIDLARKLRDVETDVGQNRTDAARKYFQDLAELEIDENDKRKEIIEEGNDKTTEIWEDYYQKLRELDAQYYFDLRDAVAENDAVGIKRLERKYNLEKQKIDGQLADKLNDEQKGVGDRLAELDEETRNRQAELTRRYQQELETINIEAQRQRDAAYIWRSREVDDLVKANERRKAAIEEEYQEELDLIQLHYQDRLTEIIRALSEQFELEKGSLRKLLTLYNEYYGTSGKLSDLVDEFYEHQEELAGELNDNIGDFDNVGGGRTENLSFTEKKTGSTVNLVISGDGSVSDATIDKLADKIADQLADAIEGILVSRGGSSGR